MKKNNEKSISFYNKIATYLNANLLTKSIMKPEIDKMINEEFNKKIDRED